MPKSIVAFGGICLVLALAALANDAPPPTQTVEEATEPAQPAASDASASTVEENASDAGKPRDAEAEASTAETAAEVKEDPIICRRVEVTGTRLKKGKVCLARSEWRKIQEEAKSAMKEVERKSAVQRCPLPPC